MLCRYRDAQLQVGENYKYICFIRNKAIANFDLPITVIWSANI